MPPRQYTHANPYKILYWIQQYHLEHGEMPLPKEIHAAFPYKSISTIYVHLNTLVKLGLLKRDRHNHYRHYRLTNAKVEVETSRVNHTSDKLDQVMEYIENYIMDKGYMPSQAEITQHFGWKSRHTAFYHLSKLYADGRLNKNPVTHKYSHPDVIGLLTKRGHHED